MQSVAEFEQERLENLIDCFRRNGTVGVVVGGHICTGSYDPPREKTEEEWATEYRIELSSLARDRNLLLAEVVKLRGDPEPTELDKLDPEGLNEMHKRRGLDRLYAVIDKALETKQYWDIDEWLGRVHPKELTTQLITGVLTITVRHKHYLQARAAWFDKAEAVIEERETDPKRIKRLLGGLK